MNSAQNQLGPNQVGPKPTRPKTKSAQNQLGPKLIGLGLGDPSPLFFSFLFSFSSSFFFFFHPLYYHWELISLKGVSIQKNYKSGACNFQTVTVMWIKVTVWNGNESENPSLILGITKNADFYFQKMAKQKTNKKKTLFFFRKWKKKKNHFFVQKIFGKTKKLKVWIKNIMAWKLR